VDSAEIGVILIAALGIVGVVWWFFPKGHAVPHDHEAHMRAEKRHHE
jgi:hypothetical protein